jgi:hypothetical protein
MNKDHRRTTVIAAEVRENLKKTFPDCKFSVRSDYHHIWVSLMAAPVSPFSKMARYSSGFDGNQESPFDGKHADLNHYHIGEKCNGYFLTPEAVTFLQHVSDIGNRTNWDESDSQTDYFNVNYYFDLSIGQWNKPFEIIPSKTGSGSFYPKRPDGEIQATPDQVQEFLEYKQLQASGELDDWEFPTILFNPLYIEEKRGAGQEIPTMLGVQEPPSDPVFFNRRQVDGSFRPLSEFFDRSTDEAPCLECSAITEHYATCSQSNDPGYDAGEISSWK